jgi:AcrR family transcriptional regulator
MLGSPESWDGQVAELGKYPLSLSNDNQPLSPAAAPPSDSAVSRERTPARRTQAERSESARTRLVAAAIEVIAESGLERFTLAEVGAGAGYSRAHPARYFKDKAGMIQAVVEQLFSTKPRPKNKEIGFEAMLGVVAAYLSGEAQDRRAQLVILGEALTRPTVKSFVAAANARTVARIEEHLVAAIEAGDIHPTISPKAQAILIMTSMRAAMNHYLLDPDSINLDALKGEFVASLRRNLMIRSDEEDEPA